MVNDPQTSPGMRSSIAAVIDQIKAERRWLILMRLVFSAAALSWFLLLTWATPWGPVAMMAPDYSAYGALGFIFAVGAAFGSIAYWLIWRPTLRYESSTEFLRILFGAGLLIRNPRQFKSRLGAEYRRSRAKRGPTFSLIVFDLPETSGARDASGPQREFEENLLAIAVRSIARAEDIVAEASSRETWVLALGASEDILPTVVGRMAATFGDAATSLPNFSGIRIGAATVGAETSNAKKLFVAARQNMVPVTELGKLRQAA